MAQISLHEMLESLYGVRTRSVRNPETNSVGTSAVRIAPSNPNRLTLLVINLSANSLYISPDAIVSSSNGIYISPNGGSLVLQWDKDFSLTSEEFYAVAGGASSTIFVLELLSY